MSEEEPCSMITSVSYLNEAKQICTTYAHKDQEHLFHPPADNKWTKKVSDYCHLEDIASEQKPDHAWTDFF